METGFSPGSEEAKKIRSGHLTNLDRERNTAKAEEKAEEDWAFLDQDEAPRVAPKRRTPEDVAISRRRFLGITVPAAMGAAIFGPRIFESDNKASAATGKKESSEVIQEKREPAGNEKPVDKLIAEEKERIMERNGYLEELEKMPIEAFDAFDMVAERIEQNRSLYEKASKIHNVPWEFIAALHYREIKSSRKVPKNGQGIYQVYGRKCPFKSGSYLDDHQMLIEIGAAMDVVNEKVTFIRDHSDLGKEGLTKKTKDKQFLKEIFFHYNGTAYGAPEKSPYVMNFLDDDHKYMPIISKDKGKIDSKDQSLGAYAMFVMLKAKYSDKIRRPQPQETKG